jgi:hypothetical protein
VTVEKQISPLRCAPVEMTVFSLVGVGKHEQATASAKTNTGVLRCAQNDNYWS